jgi:bacterial group 2 Ig-like protein
MVFPFFKKELQLTIDMNKNNLLKLALTLIMPLTLCMGSWAQAVIFPQKKQPGVAKITQKANSYQLANKVLNASFINTGGKLYFNGCSELGLQPDTELFKVLLGDGKTITASEMKLEDVKMVTLAENPSAATASLRYAGKALEARFTYEELSIVWRAVLRNGSHYLRTEMDIQAAKDLPMKGIVAMNYLVAKNSAYTAPEVVGNTRGAILASNHIFAGLETPMGLNSCKDEGNATHIEGLWRRNTTLKAGKTWNISSVVGLVAPKQLRRSFLAYSERERAVAWRPYPVYISWYELNIDRNNAQAPSYKGNMTVEQCADVVSHWKTHFYDKYQMAPKAFVWDDGWDNYGTWTFNPNFPNGFDEPANEAKQMGTGIGAWLGPVGGYGQSGEYRRAYWRSKGGMQLSNEDYYNFFIRCCTNMIDRYDFRFFKFDGISAQASAIGPDEGTRGEENAEAIISIERAVRQKRPDIFLNTTVGTWASPFWFHFTDAVWRQEGDYGEAGDQGTDRERWITYRDRLVYQNFIQRSPVCPINTLMTHGFILSRWGSVSKNMDYDGIVREMRCAFACGSGMVELYNDYKLMDEIKDNQGNAGALWKDLAECIKWQQEQADVLPDAHWVGGNPWDGKKANVYGWAAWNGKKSVLTLRNPSASAQTFTTTLREALDIPAYVRGKITLTHAFNQAELDGMPINKAIDIDTPLVLNLPGSSVFIYNGR